MPETLFDFDEVTEAINDGNFDFDHDRILHQAIDELVDLVQAVRDQVPDTYARNCIGDAVTTLRAVQYR